LFLIGGVHLHLPIRLTPATQHFQSRLRGSGRQNEKTNNQPHMASASILYNIDLFVIYIPGKVLVSLSTSCVFTSSFINAKHKNLNQACRSEVARSCEWLLPSTPVVKRLGSASHVIRLEHAQWHMSEPTGPWLCVYYIYDCVKRVLRVERATGQACRSCMSSTLPSHTYSLP
jgi:hypothetical protein